MRKKYIIYGVMAVVVIAMLVVVLVSMLVPHEYDRVTIENPEALEGMSSRSVNDFRESLILLLQDEGLAGEDMVVDDVVIRDGTVESFRYGDEGTVTTFIADIDSIRQSYEVRVIDSTQDSTDLSVYITCPRVDEMKYPEVECRGHYGDTSKSVELYLPYEGKLASGEKYLVKTITNGRSGERMLQVYLYSCDESEPPVSAAEDAAKGLLEEVGDVSEYVVNVRTGYCEGDAI